MSTALRRFYRVLRPVTAAVCLYEAGAILADVRQAPTLSTLAGRHRWISPLLVSALAVHLAFPIPEDSCTPC